MVKVLIVGDSFAADWTVKYNSEGLGWPNIIAEQFDVLNLAQAGCSEYRILKQLQSVELDNFNIILVNHTSPYRLYTYKHPIHKNDVLHHSSDLMYNDLLYHYKTNHNDKIKPIIDFFENYFDTDYFKFVYKLTFDEISKLTHGFDVINLSHIGLSNIIDNITVTEINMFNKKTKGLLNHYDEKTNKKIAKFITKLIHEKVT